MKNFKFIVIKIKSLFLPCTICIFILFLLIFSKSNLNAAKSGLLLWANSVIPSLLPFFIATELLSHTGIIPILGKLLNKFMRPIFNVPGEGAFALLMGIISGYPVGAKIVCNLKEQNLCTPVEAERLLAFTNNSGPLFIIGTVGCGMFFSPTIGIILFISHLLGSLTVGFLFRWWGKQKEKSLRNSETLLHTETLSFCNLGEALSKSIINSINTVLLIGGFVVLFSIIISIFQTSNLLSLIANIFSIINIPEFVTVSILSGLIEVTNGISFISNLSECSFITQLLLSSFVLGFGGFSVLMQVLSITSKAKISIKPYFYGKILQALFGTLYIVLLI